MVLTGKHNYSPVPAGPDREYHKDGLSENIDLDELSAINNSVDNGYHYFDQIEMNMENQKKLKTIQKTLRK